MLSNLSSIFLGIILIITKASELINKSVRGEVGLNEKLPYKMYDSHLHYLNFVQNTDGVEALVEKMKTAGIDRAVIFGIPLEKVNDGYPLSNDDEYFEAEYYQDSDARVYYYPATDDILMLDLIEYAKKNPEEAKRFYPTICGINPTDLNSAERIKRMYETSAKLGFKWRGFGELMSRHGELTAMTYGETPRADHPGFDSVYKLAAKLNLPVLIHHDISSANKKEPIYLEEIINACQANQDTVFIWAHLGINRRVEVPTLKDDLTRAFEACPNLNMDISWVVLEMYLNQEDQIDGWVEFLERYSERILVGSDKVARWNTYIDEMARYNGLFSRLSETTRENIGYKNFERIYGEPGYYTPPKTKNEL